MGEIFLKGKNRGSFEKVLKTNFIAALNGLECATHFERNRYIICDFTETVESAIIKSLTKVFGFNSISTGVRVKSDLDIITQAAISLMPTTGSFRVSANRADKSFILNSMELSRELGGRIITASPNLKVDLHTPEHTLNVDVREEGHSYLFFNKVEGAGGLPVGTSGHGLLLLSGGIDSPVAGYRMLKRGMRLTALHFHSYPYTSVEAQNKVRRLADVLRQYGGKIELIEVCLTQLQKQIQKCCSDSFMITLLRRAMVRIAERVALSRSLDCIINGESLGQVASQTVQSITATQAVIQKLSVLRPLIGYDKQEIIEIAKKIGTFDISTEPFEDCCTVFLPDKPVIKPKLEQCEYEERRIKNLDELIDEAVALAV